MASLKFVPAGVPFDQLFSQFGNTNGMGGGMGGYGPSAQVVYQQSPHYNQTPTYANGQDLTHLGYLPPPNVPMGQPVTVNLGGNGVQASGFGGAYGGGANSPYSLQQLIDMQMKQNNDARAQNQANWASSRDYLMGLAGQYNKNPSTVSAQSLTSQLAGNPLSLSPEIVRLMKNQAANQISAMGDNQFNQVRRALSADGQMDTSSMAAAREAQNRQNMGAQMAQNTNIDIAAAKQRPIDLANAAAVAQRQAGQDIGVPLGIGNSIMSNLPQIRPDDYSGLLALTNQMQNQQFQNQMMANSQFANSLKAPVALNPIGGSYRNPQLLGSNNAGFAFRDPFGGGGGGGQGGGGGWGNGPGANDGGGNGGGGLMPFGGDNGANMIQSPSNGILNWGI